MKNGKSPKITEMKVIPVAGHDSMLLNLSGAHGAFLRGISSSSPMKPAIPV